MKPVIALVGRPNVGKSTLFNRLTKSRDAIVADFAGLTRDRHYGDGRLGDREFIVIDTGGFEPDSSTGIVKEMAKQTKQAVAEADAVIFVVDIRLGLSAHDSDIARYLRSVNKRVHLAVNKAEGMSDSPLLAEFHELGMGEPHPISSAHGQGIRSLLDAVLEPFEDTSEEFGAGPQQDGVIRLAVAGRPNVGKSTLINTLVGKRAAKTGDEPGITKIEQKIVLENGFYLFDTPGMMWPRIAIEQSGYHLAASGAIGRNAFDEAEVALELIAVLKRHYPERLQERYGLAELGADDAILEAIGVKRGAKVRGGGVQMHKAAEALLMDFRGGALGRITLETPEEMTAWRRAAAEEEERKAAEREAEKAADKERRSGKRKSSSGDA